MDEHRLDLASEPRQEPPSLEKSRMFAHPYVAALAGAAALVVVGALFVARGAPAALSPSQPVAWGGAGTVFDTASGPAPESAGIVGRFFSAPSYDYTLPNLRAGADPDQAGPGAGGFDLDAFISMLSASSQPKTGGGAGGADTEDAYSFIPTGLVSVAKAPPRTPLQNSLYAYGNTLGASILAFEQEYPNAARILWDQAQDRDDAGKAAAVASFAQALGALGARIEAMDGVPEGMRSAHASLAASYRELGAKLSEVPGQKSDADFLAAVNAYNAAVETFIKRYVALADLFVAYGVVFAQTDPGSVFAFTGKEL